MIWELMSNFEFLNEYDENNSDNVLNKSLSKLSLYEVQNLKRRTAFYLTHYLILTKKNKKNIPENMVKFLQKMDDILANELNQRKKKIFI